MAPVSTPVAVVCGSSGCRSTTPVAVDRRLQWLSFQWLQWLSIDRLQWLSFQWLQWLSFQWRPCWLLIDSSGCCSSGFSGCRSTPVAVVRLTPVAVVPVDPVAPVAPVAVGLLACYLVIGEILLLHDSARIPSTSKILAYSWFFVPNHSTKDSAFWSLTARLRPSKPKGFWMFTMNKASAC